MSIRDKILAVLRGDGCKGCVDGSIHNCGECKTDTILAIEVEGQWRDAYCGLPDKCPLVKDSPLQKHCIEKGNGSRNKCWSLGKRPATIADLTRVE